MFESLAATHATRAKRADDTGVMMATVDDVGAQTTMYGDLYRIIHHRLHPDGPAMVFVEVNWHANVRTVCDGRMPIVRRLARGRQQDGGAPRVVPVTKLYAQHVVFWPLDSDRWDPSGDLCAIYREADTRIDKSRLTR